MDEKFLRSEINNLQLALVELSREVNELKREHEELKHHQLMDVSHIQDLESKVEELDNRLKKSIEEIVLEFEMN